LIIAPPGCELRHILVRGRHGCCFKRSSKTDLWALAAPVEGMLTISVPCRIRDSPNSGLASTSASGLTHFYRESQSLGAFLPVCIVKPQLLAVSAG
jgi:hypothetical protein